MSRIPVAFEASYGSMSWTGDGQIFAMATVFRSTLWRFQPEGKK